MSDMKRYLGIKDGKAVYVSEELLEQYGEHYTMQMLGMVKFWPVITDLSGHTIMVEGETHEDAVQRYLTKGERKSCKVQT